MVFMTCSISWVVVLVIFLEMNTGTLGAPKSMEFERCGGMGLNDAHGFLSPCDSKPCVLVKKTKVNVKFDFIMPFESRTARLEIRAKYGIFNIPVLGVPTDFCVYPGISCPLHKGQLYRTQTTMPIRTYYPEATGNLTIKGFGDNDQLLFCGSMPLTVLPAKQ